MGHLAKRGASRQRVRRDRSSNARGRRCAPRTPTARATATKDRTVGSSTCSAWRVAAGRSAGFSPLTLSDSHGCCASASGCARKSARPQFSDERPAILGSMCTALRHGTRPVAASGAIRSGRSRILCSVESTTGAVAIGVASLLTAPFGSRCPTSNTMAPFPVAAHRTGHADFPHPALGQGIMLSPTEGRVGR